jgi:hypothetical protein
MLDFAAQKKILDPILKHPKNHVCADCDSVSPTCTLSLIKGPLSTSEFSYAETVQVHTELSAPPSQECVQPISTNGRTNGSAI